MLHDFDTLYTWWCWQNNNHLFRFYLGLSFKIEDGEYPSWCIEWTLSNYFWFLPHDSTHLWFGYFRSDKLWRWSLCLLEFFICVLMLLFPVKLVRPVIRSWIPSVIDPTRLLKLPIRPHEKLLTVVSIIVTCILSVMSVVDFTIIVVVAIVSVRLGWSLWHKATCPMW